MKGDVAMLSDVGRLRHRRGYGKGREDERRSIAKERWLDATPVRMLWTAARRKEGFGGRISTNRFIVRI